MLNRRMSMAGLIRKHLQMHTAQRVVEMYVTGESYTSLLENMTPEMRLMVEGILRAAAESWSAATAIQEEKEQGNVLWLQ